MAKRIEENRLILSGEAHLAPFEQNVAWRCGKSITAHYSVPLGKRRRKRNYGRNGIALCGLQRLRNPIRRIDQNGIELSLRERIPTDALERIEHSLGINGLNGIAQRPIRGYEVAIRLWLKQFAQKHPL